MLIDTHILLWTLEGTAGRMGPKTIELLKQDFEKVSVSSASLFEIRMKQRRGQLAQFDIDAILRQLQASAIPVLDINANEMLTIPGRDMTEHADPFDLLLIGQAIAENLPFVTCDEKILKINSAGLRLIDGRL